MQMDLEVNALTLKRLRSSELIGFAKRVIAVMDNVYGETAYPFADEFKTAYLDYADAVGTASIPVALEACDARNDDKWLAMNYYLKAILLHDDPAVADAAAIIKKEFDSIPNPIRLPYDEEIGKLESLLKILDHIPSETRAAAHFDEWIAMLRNALDAYNHAAQRQTEIEAGRITGNTTQKRSQLMDAYRAMTQKINAMHLLALDGRINILIPQLNALIDKTNTRLKNRAHRNNSADDPDIDFES